MRILILQRLIALGLSLIWGGLFITQILQGPQYRRQAQINRMRLVHLPAPRGALLDRNGVPLVEDRIGFELDVFPQELKSPAEMWARLQPVVGIPPQALERTYRKGYQAPFSLVPLVRDLDPKTAFLIEERRSEFPGAVVRPIPKRRYLLGPALGPVTGYLGLINSEELTKLKPYGYTFRDWVGKEGLEQTYDRVLRGRDGGLQVEVDARGRMVRQLGFLKPERGRRITLTIDGRLQRFSHHLLEGARGAIVVMDPSLGEILSLVSQPSFDPNVFVDSTQGHEVRRLLRRPDRPMFNRATRGMVPPGSTFKVAVAYWGLKLGSIQAGTSFHCPGFFELGRGLFRCWREEGHGDQDVTAALEHSCNVFFYNTGRRLGVERIIQAAHLFGLGVPTGIDLPREAKGLVPDPAWMKATHGQPWTEGDTASLGIGQGPLLTTPMQMLGLITAVAMEGQVPKPHLIRAMEGEPPVKIPGRLKIPLDPFALAHVKVGLERVVNSPTGTGRLAEIPDVRVAGKTGTAQVPRGLSHAWFYGYAPADRPRVSFVIFLEHGGKGGEQAAWVARDLLAYLKELEYL